MARQFSTSLRNAWLDLWESHIGTSAIIKLRTGAPPANVAAADSGTVLAQIDCPSDYMAAAASGSKAKTGTWEDPTANAQGTLGHYRVYQSDGTTCHEQGTIGVGSGDLQVDNLSVEVGQKITITGFTITAPGA